MSTQQNVALALAMPDELLAGRDSAAVVPTTDELESLDAAIAEIETLMAHAGRHSLDLADRREQLLTWRTDLRRRRERAGLIEAGELVKWIGIDYVGTVADYFDPDPNLMRGDGLRQVWPPGELERICRAKLRR